MTCQRCVFSKVQLKEFVPGLQDRPGDLLCRRHPPTAMPVGAMTPQGMAVQIITAWPTVKAGDQCGEYQPALN